MCPSVAYEMLVSHSPPVFSHSPPTGFLSEYPFLKHTDQLPRSLGICRSTSPLTINRNSVKMPASPKRPCLVIRPDETSCNEDLASPTRLKKKVVFADDKGMSLTHVRIMTEPSNVPPLWSYRFLAEVTQGLSAEPEALDEPWEVLFPQPASDYVDFRKKLDTNKVSLENVMVKEAEDIIMGTIKVSNISFHKEVIVRMTLDSWKTSEDISSDFVPSASTSSVTQAYVLYDTFSFKIPLKQRQRRIDFCVCFRCDGNEYWDNNDNKNYTIMKNTQLQQKSQNQTEDIYKKPSGGVNLSELTQKRADTKLDSWSEFASWTHLENSGPYW